MPKLKSRSRARLATAAGLTTGAVGAALLIAPTAAFAAVSVTPAIAPPLANVTITDTDATFFTGATTAGNRVQLLPATTTACPATISTTSATILAAVTVASDNTAKTVQFTLPAGATANASGQIKRYVACVYTPTGSDTRVGSATGYTVQVGGVPTVNPTIATTGGGGTITVTAPTDYPVFTGVTAVGAAFATGACPAALGTPTAGTSATVTRESNTVVSLAVPTGVTSTTARPTEYTLCLYNGTGATGALISSVPFASSQLALSQATGPYQGGNGLNITSPNQFLAGVDTPGVVFSTAACPSTYTQTESAYVLNSAAGTKYVPAANVRKLTNTRMAVTVPALLASAPSAALGFNVCVYGGQGIGTSALIASTTYTATTVHVSTGITPKAGPALGGRRIIVTGTAFPVTAGAITATLGGSPLEDITPISATAFEATTPQHAPANNVALVVSTAAGQHILPNAYTFTSALVVTPNTAPNTRAVDVIVNGVGFQSAAWNSNLLLGSHIFLVEGVYNPSILSADRANSPVADCANVLVLSDTEAICNLNLARRLDKEGDAFLVPANAAAPANTLGIDTTVGSRVVTAAAATFTEESIGLSIFETTPTNVPANTTIIDVLSDTTALISANATASNTNITADLRTPTARATTIDTTTGGTATTITGTFTSADIGKVVVSADVPAGSVITAVPSGTTATISGAGASGAGTGTAALLLQPYLPVPEGAYNLTYVSNAAVNAVGNDVNYVQSQVSSGSTFTVSSF